MKTIKPAAVRRSLEVKASIERAFEVFTVGFGSWWPHSHTIGKGKLKTAVIEPRVGGRWYGEDEDGTKTDWGHVLAFDRPSHLVLAWQINSIGASIPRSRARWNCASRRSPQTSPASSSSIAISSGSGPKFKEMQAAFESPNGWGAIMSLFAAAAEADEAGTSGRYNPGP